MFDLLLGLTHDVPGVPSKPPFKWLAWMIVGAVGAASMGGPTWRDGPAVLAKGLILAGLCTAAAVVAFILVRVSRR